MGVGAMPWHRLGTLVLLLLQLVVLTLGDTVPGSAFYANACGVLQQSGHSYWYFVDVSNQVNHAAKLRILAYQGQSSAFFAGQHIQPSMRQGNTVLWGPLDEDLPTEAAICTVRSDAVLSNSYAGQCGALGFQQSLVTGAGLQGTELTYVAAGQSTEYTSIEDCCSLCAPADARRLQETTCNGYTKRQGVYLSGGASEKWTTATPAHRSDAECCEACDEAEGCAGFTVYGGRCFLTLGEYIVTEHADMDSFVRTPIGTPAITGVTTNVGIPITGTGGNLASNAYAEDRGTFVVGHASARLPDGSISNFAASIVNATALALSTVCASQCVDKHTLSGAEHAVQVAHYRPRVGTAPVLDIEIPGVPINMTIDHIRCYCYATDPRSSGTRAYTEYSSNYAITHFGLKHMPPSPPPPPPSPPVASPPSTDCQGFVVSGNTCRLYTSNLVDDSPDTGNGGTSIWTLAPPPPPPPALPPPPPERVVECLALAQRKFVTGATVHKRSSVGRLSESCPQWCESVATTDCEIREQLLLSETQTLWCGWQQDVGCHIFAGEHTHELATSQSSLYAASLCSVKQASMTLCETASPPPPDATVTEVPGVAATVGLYPNDQSAGTPISLIPIVNPDAIPTVIPTASSATAESPSHPPSLPPAPELPSNVHSPFPAWGCEHGLEAASGTTLGSSAELTRTQCIQSCATTSNCAALVYSSSPDSCTLYSSIVTQSGADSSVVCHNPAVSGGAADTYEDWECTADAERIQVTPLEHQFRRLTSTDPYGFTAGSWSQSSTLIEAAYRNQGLVPFGNFGADTLLPEPATTHCTAITDPCTCCRSVNLGNCAGNTADTGSGCWNNRCLWRNGACQTEQSAWAAYAANGLPSWFGSNNCMVQEATCVSPSPPPPPSSPPPSAPPPVSEWLKWELTEVGTGSTSCDTHCALTSRLCDEAAMQDQSNLEAIDTIAEANEFATGCATHRVVAEVTGDDRGLIANPYTAAAQPGSGCTDGDPNTFCSPRDASLTNYYGLNQYVRFDLGSSQEVKGVMILNHYASSAHVRTGDYDVVISDNDASSGVYGQTNAAVCRHSCAVQDCGFQACEGTGRYVFIAMAGSGYANNFVSETGAACPRNQPGFIESDGCRLLTITEVDIMAESSGCARLEIMDRRYGPYWDQPVPNIAPSFYRQNSQNESPLQYANPLEKHGSGNYGMLPTCAATIGTESWGHRRRFCICSSPPPPAPPLAPPGNWIQNLGDFQGCDDIEFGNGDGNTKTQTCFRTDTINNQFTLWHGRSEHFDETQDKWPQAYNQWPADIHGSNTENWYYTRPTMAGGSPCPNEGGAEFTLARGAYMIMGVTTGTNVGSFKPAVTWDLDLDGNEQPMYPNDYSLNNGGGAVDMQWPARSCTACGFSMHNLPWGNIVTWNRRFLAPGYHFICNRWAWSTGAFLRQLRQDEYDQLTGATFAPPAPPTPASRASSSATAKEGSFRNMCRPWASIMGSSPWTSTAAWYE